MVLAPEHPLVARVTTPELRRRGEGLRAAAARKAELERVALDDDKAGVFTGGFAINPVNGERLPIWIADYVLMTYGSGAIMAVPAHDQRDFRVFATRYGIEIRTVIAPPIGRANRSPEAFLDDGPMVNSGRFDGTIRRERASARSPSGCATRARATLRVNYKLRDWLISRQRYWGTPIPIVHCDAAAARSPCPKTSCRCCCRISTRSTRSGWAGARRWNPPRTGSTRPVPTAASPDGAKLDTLGGFACSSWYFLRFCSPDQHDQAFDLDAIRRWMPVDLYVGGPSTA